MNAGLLKSLSCTLALLGAMAVQAQATEAQVKVKMTMGPDDGSDRGLLPLGLLPGGATTMIMATGSEEVRVKKGEVAITKLSLFDREKLGFLRTTEPTTNGQRTLVVERVEQFGGKPVMIATQTSFDREEVVVSWQYMDPGLTKANAPFEELCRFQFRHGTYTGPDSLKYGPWDGVRQGFRTSISADGSKMLILSPEMRQDEAAGSWTFIVVDKTMKVLWYDFLRYDGANRLRLLDATVDNNGRAIAITSLDKGAHTKATKDKKEEAFPATVLNFIDAKGVVSMPWELGNEHYPASAKLLPLPDGRIACGAVRGTSKEGNAAYTPGLFMAFLPLGGTKFDGLSEIELPEKEKGKAYSNLQINDILPCKGGYYLTAEVMVDKVTTTSLTSASTKALRVTHTYTHNDVVVVRTDTAGKQVWESTFVRELVSPSFSTGSALATVWNDQLFLFVLDDEKNLELRKKNTEPPVKTEMKNASTQLVTFDAKGQFKCKVMLNRDNDRDLIAGDRILWTSPTVCFALGTPRAGSDAYMPVKIEFAKDAGK